LGVVPLKQILGRAGFSFLSVKTRLALLPHPPSYLHLIRAQTLHHRTSLSIRKRACMCVKEPFLCASFLVAKLYFFTRKFYETSSKNFPSFFHKSSLALVRSSGCAAAPGLRPLRLARALTYTYITIFTRTHCRYQGCCQQSTGRRQAPPRSTSQTRSISSILKAFASWYYRNVYVYICGTVHIYLSIYIYIYMYVWMYLCSYVCINISIHIHSYMHENISICQRRLTTSTLKAFAK